MGSGRFSSTKCQVACILVNLCVFLICTTDACYIQNCPRGGKRAIAVNEGGAPRQCMTCGPNGEGQCVGSNICCLKVGCVIGDVVTKCMRENENPDVCEVKGKPCGKKGQGRCVTNGVCCDPSACAVNSNCA